MKLTFDYDELNRIIQLYVCQDLELTPVSDIEVTVPEEPYGSDVSVSIMVHHEDDEVEDCEDHHHHHHHD